MTLNPYPILLLWFIGQGQFLTPVNQGSLGGTTCYKVCTTALSNLFKRHGHTKQTCPKNLRTRIKGDLKRGTWKKEQIKRSTRKWYSLVSVHILIYDSGHQIGSLSDLDVTRSRRGCVRLTM